MNPPLERTARPGAAAWENLNAGNQREMAEHDKNVAGMSLETHLAAIEDLRRRRASNRADPLQRWEMSRQAAHLRAVIGYQRGRVGDERLALARANLKRL